MSDIVEKVAAVWDRKALEAELAQASAKMVEQAAEIERLRAALREIASHNDNPYFDAAARKITARTVAIARAALGEKA